MAAELDRPRLAPRIPPGVARRAAALFLPLAVLATATCGLAYAEIQQDLRSSANDPQFQLAEEAAARLDAGAAPPSWTPARRSSWRPALHRS